MEDFSSLNIRPAILQNIMFLGFDEMTPIQDMVIPIALKGRDVIGQAKTGTGKTFAFVIPILQNVDLRKKSVQAVVLTPTRELAFQVGTEFEKLAGTAVKVALVYGGAGINPQIEALKKGAQVVVGTPGRVIDHLKRGTMDLGNVGFFVLDEADRMLDMGFIEDVEWIIDKTPKKRQTMLFSATMPEEIQKLGEKHMRKPEFIQASSDEDLTIGDVDQYYVKVFQKDKMDSFFKVIEEEDPNKGLVFCKTKKWVETLYGIMRKKGFSVDRIHGDLSQAAREKAIDKLRSGKVKFLVCTDVAARGLDIDDITHVFNYDIPQEPLTYVHRIGRTGRAGKKGVAITFLNPDETRDLWMMEHRARTTIEERPVDLTGGTGLIIHEPPEKKRRTGRDSRGGRYGGRKPGGGVSRSRSKKGRSGGGRRKPGGRRESRKR